MATGHEHNDSNAQGSGTAVVATVKRRGILAAAGAVVAGLVAKQAAQPVAAGSGSGDQGFLALGSNPWYKGGPIIGNTAAISSAPTVIQATPNFGNFLGYNGADVTVFEVDARPATGSIHGIMSFSQDFGTGVYGVSSSGYGVYGQSSSSFGVRGQSTSGTGVDGDTSSGIGVLGSSTSNDGVYGYSYGSAASNGNGVHGFVAHVGSTQVTAGVFGDSSASYGVLGRTTANGYSGCTGIADGAGRAAFAGAGTNGAYGAYFVGPTVVQGDLTVVGGQKNAAVKQADGSYRVLHCVESPEAWFEDFGKGNLVGGKAAVKLAADFAGVVDTSSYHVFLTEYGASNHLFVATQSASGFVVQSEKAGANGTFSWRVVAKRKDIAVGRMARFALPGITLPTVAELPQEPPTPPPAPAPVPVSPVPSVPSVSPVPPRAPVPVSASTPAPVPPKRP